METKHGPPRLAIGESRRISPPGGRHWFPRLFTMPDGSLLQINSTVDDSIEAIGQVGASAGRVSRDGGATWAERAMPAHYGFPVALADGRCRSFSYILWQRADGRTSGLMSELPAGGTTWSDEREYAVQLPSARQPADSPSRIVLDRTVLREADGTLLGTLYGRLDGDAKYRCLVARSANLGTTWWVVGTIAHDPHIDGEGYCEPVMARLGDGSLLAVMRTGGGDSPLYQSRSRDGGQTWGEPESLGVYSVDPDLCLMERGVLACSFGRPDVKVMFSLEGSGEQWTEPVTVFAGNSTCYTGLREVAPGRLLLVYDSNPHGSPWRAGDNQVNAVSIDLL
jgi:hypothetical protein